MFSASLSVSPWPIDGRVDSPKLEREEFIRLVAQEDLRDGGGVRGRCLFDRERHGRVDLGEALRPKELV